MKQKYYDAIKFYYDTQNDEQLNIAYKEFDPFMECYIRFKWYHDYNKEELLKHLSGDDM
jgi:hypothetical protein